MAKKYFNCNNLTYHFESADAPIIQNLSVTFAAGWTALVGANGTGKSTLLKLLCSVIPCQTGSISSHLFSYYLNQVSENVPESLSELIDSYDYDAIKYKELLDIGYDWAERWSTLSNGEQKRAQIAVALYQKPDLLAVDEPTNHLDSDTAGIVLQALKEFKGIGLIVTHDRSLLNNLQHNTLLFLHNNISYHGCRWTEALRGRQQQQKYSEVQAGLIQKQIKKIKKEENKRRALSQNSKSKLSKKNVSLKDYDAKAKINAARLTNKDTVDSRAANRLESRRSHLEEMVKDANYIKKYSSRIEFFTSLNHKEKTALDITPEEIELDIDRTLKIPGIAISKGEKVAITGKNGIGKSTLIKKIIGEISFLTNNVLYIPQEITEKDSHNILEEIKSLPSDEEGKVFTIITRFGSSPKQLICSEYASPGEIRKLMLAQAIHRQVDLIILDEPTNHLDILTIKSLEDALKEYLGTLLFVSHDNYFIEEVADRIIQLYEEDNVVRLRYL